MSAHYNALKRKSWETSASIFLIQAKVKGMMTGQGNLWVNISHDSKTGYVPFLRVSWDMSTLDGPFHGEIEETEFSCCFSRCEKTHDQERKPLT